LAGLATYFNIKCFCFENLSKGCSKQYGEREEFEAAGKSTTKKDVSVGHDHFYFLITRQFFTKYSF